MLQMLASGLTVSEGSPRQQLEAAKQPSLPPLPAGLLAGAAAAGRAERLGRHAPDGADTVRPRSLAASQVRLEEWWTVWGGDRRGYLALSG